MRVLCYAQTNIGSGRDNNEDNYYCNGTFKRDAAVPVAEAAAEQEGKRLIYGVFDGMGGEANGEQAALLCGVGVPTLLDVAAELQKPGRDPRDELPKPILRTDVLSIADLKPGIELTGTVRNVIDFGAFVDIGVHQDGLVHISQICDRFIRHPSEAVKVGDIVTFWVLGVDLPKKRIFLFLITSRFVNLFYY